MRGGWILRGLLGCVLLLQGCNSLILPPAGGPAEAPAARSAQATGIPPLRGVVDFGDGAPRQVASMNQVAQAATVSLIESATGATKSTTKTDDSGMFDLAFSGGFAPAANTV